MIYSQTGSESEGNKQEQKTVVSIGWRVAAIILESYLYNVTPDHVFEELMVKPRQRKMIEQKANYTFESAKKRSILDFLKDLIEGIRTSEDAREFLYGRIFNYLSPNAQYLFATISILVDNDLRFNFDVLEYVLGKVIPEKDQFEASIDEVINQKVIERNNDVYGRVYSAELLQMMTARYNEYPQDFRDTVRNLLNSIGGKDIEGDILEAMLTQADKSRAFSNEKETVEKYRRVLNNSKCSYNLRKSALKRLSDYLSNSRLNPVAAISVIEEYIHFFIHDSDIYTLYVYLLWSQEVLEKEKAVNTIREFFAKGSHKKTSNDYLTFFALGTGYCINFDILYRKYEEEKLRKQQYRMTFNEYGKELFDFIKNAPLS
ncbi:hypothetical protein [Desulfosporosinus metallidurans]|uniref:Uncharacterized protein n=1 Tax=Desulfosporosinus metallidurans TaxID=1888891 RepID=A0A1Q8QSQ1_9FIRM|nr:hypothetical protein [Desulfosporosinus metallidurans]OLN30342.1 hypothetical protein DSOL_3107 [Desulfosporosinus metallidurans]